MSNKSNVITLLHLSDLHAQADTTWDSKRVTDDLVADLQHLAHDDAPRPDLVLFTGDLAQAGTTEDFERGWDVIRAIQRAYKPSLTNAQVFLVPGNHDVDRTKVGRGEKGWLRSANAEDAETLIQEGGRDWDRLTERLDDYRAFLKAHGLKHLQPNELCASRAIWHATRSVAGASIGLAGFNTAWCSGEDEEQGRLWMGAHWQHETLYRSVREADVRIALLHHPPSWLHPHEAPNFRRKLTRDFHLVLHGHEHHDWMTIDDRGHATLEAGACYAGSREKNGYSVIRLDRTTGQIDVHLRRYDDGWVKRPVANRAENGIWTFRTPWLGGPDEEEAGEIEGDGETNAPTPAEPPPVAPTPPAEALTDDHNRQLDDFLRHQRIKNADLPMAGFPATVRIPITLDAIYVPLRASLHDHRVMHRDGMKDEPSMDADESIAPLPENRDVPFDQAIRQAQRRKQRGAVVLGDPGSGKTTLLKHFLLADPTTLGLPADTVPVLVLLRSLEKPGAGLRQAIAQSLQLTCTNLGAIEADDLAGHLLQRGRLLLLFDGLDEVAQATARAAIARWLEDEIKVRTRCFFVLTSRYAAYRADARLSGGHFLELHVRPLIEDEAKTFMGKWYGAVAQQFGREPDGRPATSADAEDRTQRLASRVFDGDDKRNASLRDLATNPLMLQILCLLFWDQGHLPEKRAELYEACVRTLLQLWRDAKRQRAAQRDLPMIGHQDALAVLQPLAWHLHQHNARELPEAKVIEAIAQPLQMRSELDLTPTAFLQQVRDQTGVLVSLGRGDYGFLHLSFQEYLAACHVQNSVADEPEIFDALAANFGDDWWREVILLSLGLTNPSLFGRLMAHLVRSKALSRDVLLASDCLRDAAEPSANALLQLLRSGIDDAGERYQVLRLLKSSRLGAWRDATVVGKETGRDVLRAIGRKEKSAEVRSLLSELLGEEITVSPSLGTKMRRAFARFLGVRPPGPDFAGSTVIGERVHEKDGSVLVYVPGGSYTLGGEAYSDEKPIHMVTLSPYWIGKYPVTNAQYGTFLEATKRGKPSRWNDKQFNGPDQPVVGVSWHDAQAYCAWAGLILPSEAQWEASARGTDQRTYPWGDGEPTKKLANYGKNVGRTTPVGSYPDGAGPFGMLDQAGNVWEWCVDVWSDDAYKGREGQEDPVNTVGDKTVRALRGGSWILVPRWLRGAFRHGDRVAYRLGSRGFRVCVPAPRTR